MCRACRLAQVGAPQRRVSRAPLRVGPPYTDFLSPCLSFFALCLRSPFACSSWPFCFSVGEPVARPAASLILPLALSLLSPTWHLLGLLADQLIGSFPL